MPLLFPDEHKPDLSWPHVAELRVGDSDTGHIVRVMVWDKCIEDHAIAAGWPEPLGEYDRAEMLAAVLERLILQASATYDAHSKPAFMGRTPSQTDCQTRHIPLLRKERHSRLATDSDCFLLP
jgi:hypothetical protein